jgi:replication factor C subunit 2/4
MKTAKCHTGIDVVRNRIKGFAQKKVTLPPGRHKLVILDEADRLEKRAPHIQHN